MGGGVNRRRTHAVDVYYHNTLGGHCVQCSIEPPVSIQKLWEEQEFGGTDHNKNKQKSFFPYCLVGMTRILM